MKKIAGIIFGLAFSAFAFAQFVDADALNILNKTSEKIKKTTGISGSFDLIVKDAQTEKTQTFAGSFLLKGDKFKMSLNNIETYFDGKTQWVYMAGNKEVTISNPTADELKDVNPLLLLSSYKKDYQIKKDEDKTVNGKPAYNIVIYPVQKDAPYFQIAFLIDKTMLQPLKIEARSRDGITTTVKLKQYLDNQNLANEKFTCVPPKDVEIIDLR